MLRFLYGFKKLLNIIKRRLEVLGIRFLKDTNSRKFTLSVFMWTKQDRKSHSQNTNFTVTANYFGAVKNNGIRASSWFVSNHIFSGVKLCFKISFLDLKFTKRSTVGKLYEPPGFEPGFKSEIFFSLSLPLWPLPCFGSHKKLLVPRLGVRPDQLKPSLTRLLRDH